MQQPIELILARQWASYLTVSVWLYNEKGDLIYCNEPADKLLGIHFESFGEISANDVMNIFKCVPLDESEAPLESVPINIAHFRHQPAHKKFKILTLDGIWKSIESTAIPVLGQGGKYLGTVSIFWELNDL